MSRMFVVRVMVATAYLWALSSVQGEDQAHEDGARGRAAPEITQSQAQNPRAQSGATAAEEARIYTAQLRRCEGLGSAEREACVGAAKRRLGQL